MLTLRHIRKAAKTVQLVEDGGKYRHHGPPVEAAPEPVGVTVEATVLRELILAAEMNRACIMCAPDGDELAQLDKALEAARAALGAVQ